MKKAIIGLVILTVIGVGVYFNIPKRFLSKLPHSSIKLPDSISLPQRDASSSGEVAGVSTQAQETGNAVLQKGMEVGKTISTIFLSSPDQKTQTIEVQKVVEQVQKQVESIPSNVLEQAKVQYCTAVLQNATSSATSH